MSGQVTGQVGKQTPKRTPKELKGYIAWDTFCPVSRLGDFVGQIVTG